MAARHRADRPRWPYRNTLGLAVLVFVASFGIGTAAQLDLPTGYAKPLRCITCHG